MKAKTTSLERAERRVRVMRMRNSGMTVPAIAARVGVSTGTVDRDIRDTLREALADSLEDRVGAQLSQIDDLRRAVYARALGGDDGAFDRVLKLMERESKLLGLDAPTRVVAHVSTEDFASTAATLLREMGVQPPEAIEAAASQRADLSGSPTVIDAEVEPVIAASERESERYAGDDWVQ